MAAPPELLHQVGFEKTKIGSDDKDLGYEIKESSLQSLLGSACLCFLVMGLMVVSMVYDIHFEKKTLHRQLRQEEHHAASKLAKVQMELWSEFHNDIQESHEAKALLHSMNESYSALQGKIKGAVDELSAELNMNPIKAGQFADKLLHLVADMAADNTKKAKHLVDHLVAAGKKSVKLEKHVDKEMLKEAKAEKRHLEEDKKEGIDVTPHAEKKPAAKVEKTKDKKKSSTADKSTTEEPKDAAEMEDMDEDPMKETLKGFFETFHDFEREFKGKPQENMQDGKPIYEKVKELHEKIKKEDSTMTEEDMQKELDKIDLASVGAGLGSGRVLPVPDVVEELFLIPKMPFDKLTALEKEWQSGKKDSMQVFEELQEFHEQQIVPTSWLMLGVDKEEMEEEKEEEMSAKETEDKE